MLLNTFRDLSPPYFEQTHVFSVHFCLVFPFARWKKYLHPHYIDIYRFDQVVKFAFERYFRFNKKNRNMLSHSYGEIWAAQGFEAYLWSSFFQLAEVITS